MAAFARVRLGFPYMKLLKKLALYVAAASFIAAVLGILIQKRVIDSVEIDRTREAMRSTLLQAETVRKAGSALVEAGAFDLEKLAKELETASDYRETTLYKTVPVVAAWQSVQEIADELDYSFRVTKRHARNPDNEPTAAEEQILDFFSSTGESEYFFDDKENDVLVYARPVVLSRDCLFCHGDPADSLTGDGKDILGFEMEGWKEGEMHGAFVLKTGKEGLRAMGTQALIKGASHTAMVAIPAVAVLICVMVFLLRRSVVIPVVQRLNSIMRSCDGNRNLATGISESGEALADGVNRQAASVEESSATLEELSSATNGNVQMAGSAQEHVRRANSAVQDGVQKVDEMQKAINMISESSSSISRIIGTIDEIAFQTNILALNASVEAARAGEAGAGFAVVADEVRSLAQKSARAAKESSEILADSIARSEAGASVSAEFVTQLEEIKSEIGDLESVIDEIRNASEQQNEGITQLNVAVQTIDKVAQSTAASSEELASSALDLQRRASLAQDEVRQMISLVDGEKQGGEEAARPAQVARDDQFDWPEDVSRSGTDSTFAKN